jgi:large subunit ribosomal protein L21
MGAKVYAVIQTGGRQYKVKPGEELRVEKLDGKVGDEVYFDKVLLVSKGDEVTVGRPILENAKVVARITRQARGPKIVIFKYKRRKRYRKKQGHRQDFTGLKIIGIEV